MSQESKRDFYNLRKKTRCHSDDWEDDHHSQRKRDKHNLLKRKLGRKQSFQDLDSHYHRVSDYSEEIESPISFNLDEAYKFIGGFGLF